MADALEQNGSLLNCLFKFKPNSKLYSYTASKKSFPPGKWLFTLQNTKTRILTNPSNMNQKAVLKQKDHPRQWAESPRQIVQVVQIVK